jgi:hypothetical protein
MSARPESTPRACASVSGTCAAPRCTRRPQPGAKTMFGTPCQDHVRRMLHQTARAGLSPVQRPCSAYATPDSMPSCAGLSPVHSSHPCLGPCRPWSLASSRAWAGLGRSRPAGYKAAVPYGRRAPRASRQDTVQRPCSAYATPDSMPSCRTCPSTAPKHYLSKHSAAAAAVPVRRQGTQACCMPLRSGAEGCCGCGRRSMGAAQEEHGCCAGGAWVMRQEEHG